MLETGIASALTASEQRSVASLQRQIAAHEQRFPKRSRVQKIDELLALQNVGRHARQRLVHLRRQVAAEHRREIRLAQVREAMRGGALDELVEVHRLVHFLQVIVKDVVIGLRAQEIGLEA